MRRPGEKPQAERQTHLGFHFAGRTIGGMQEVDVLGRRETGRTRHNVRGDGHRCSSKLGGQLQHLFAGEGTSFHVDGRASWSASSSPYQPVHSQFKAAASVKAALLQAYGVFLNARITPGTASGCGHEFAGLGALIATTLAIRSANFVHQHLHSTPGPTKLPPTKP